MAERRVQLVTTLYGKRLVTLAQLFELHREVSRAATNARIAYDSKYRETTAMGRSVSRSRVIGTAV